jgi:hypothetical protein
MAYSAPRVCFDGGLNARLPAITLALSLSVFAQVRKTPAAMSAADWRADLESLLQGNAAQARRGGECAGLITTRSR